MVKIFSKAEEGTLLHLINRLTDITDSEEKRRDLSPTEEFLQMATLKLPQGQTFKAHKHLWRTGEAKIIPQESWIVIRGSVKFLFFDLDDQKLGETILHSGDCSMTFQGGHTYEIMQEDTIVYEVKSARYYGQEKDKVFI